MSSQQSHTSDNGYIHGYSTREEERLCDQADTLTGILHHDTYYPPGSLVLEAGCGVGAQTVILAKNSPQACFTSMDISPISLETAKERINREGFINIRFEQADIYHLPFGDEIFDHVFVCFMLEHLAGPTEALIHLKRVLKPGGTITVIEGDHDSAIFHPDSPDARRVIRCLVESQAREGGNACIGRQLFPLLSRAGYRHVKVSPRIISVDGGRPDFVEGFTKNTFIAMVAGVREQVMTLGLARPEQWDKGIEDLNRTTLPDGTFYYTFFKGVAIK